MTQPVVDWQRYRKCIKVCRAAIGEPCFTVNARIVDGRPVGGRTPLEQPHASRLLRGRRVAWRVVE